MPVRPHIIHRQVLDLTLGSRQDAFAVQQSLRSAYYERVLPALDEVFSALLGPEAVLRLDRLELDLGRLSAATLEADFARAVRRAMEEALAAHLGVGYRAGKPPPDAPFITPERSLLAALAVFLETGTLPWWVSAPEAFAPSAVVAELLETAPTALAAMLRARRRPVVGQRLTRQITPDVLGRLVQRLAPSAAPALRACQRAWNAVLLAWSSATTDQVERLLWNVGLSLALNAPVPSPDQLPEAFNNHVLDRLAAEAGLPPDAVVGLLLPEAEQALPEADPLVAWLQAEQARRAPASSEDKDPPAAASGDHEPEAAPRPPEDPHAAPGAATACEPRPPSETPIDEPVAMGVREEPAWRPPEARGDAPTTDPAASTRTSASELLQDGAALREAPVRRGFEVVPAPPGEPDEALLEGGETRYVTNAGLVLIWPFLRPFFNHLTLVERGAFVSEEAQRRAVLLTQALVTGKAEAPEHLLPLNKLLCGWPVEQPVDFGITITNEEREACHEVLASAVGHWTALKRTSVEAFRGAFMRREGRLRQQDTGWRLKVQRSAYDVLLDTLPWSLGVVAQPWMPEPIYVEW